MIMCYDRKCEDARALGEDIKREQNELPLIKCTSTDRMDVATALILMVMIFIASSLITCIGVYRYRDSNAPLLKTSTSRPPRPPALVGNQALDKMLYKASKLLPLVFVLLMWGCWLWIWWPVYKNVLPALNQSRAKALAFYGNIEEVDLDADGMSTLKEMQSRAQVSIVADPADEFESSKNEWHNAIMPLNERIKQDFNRQMDGDPSVQPAIIVFFIGVTAIFTYTMILTFFMEDLWMDTWATRWLQYRTVFNPGNYIFVPMLPLFTFQVYTVTRVLHRAYGIAEYMERNMKNLKKIKRKIIHDDLPDAARQAKSLEDYMADMVGRRWGIVSMGYHIDKTFRDALMPRVYFSIALIFAVIPLAVLGLNWRRERAEKSKAEAKEVKAKEAQTKAEAKAAEARVAAEEEQQLRKEEQQLKKEAQDKAGDKEREAEIAVKQAEVHRQLAEKETKARTAAEEAAKVRKTPSWPRSWANFSLF
jgi:hypothetical protein